MMGAVIEVARSARPSGAGHTPSWGGFRWRAAAQHRCARRQPTAHALLILLAVAALSRPATAFEAFDGRVELHGFYESQMRFLSADFSDDMDMAQWWHILNLELELALVERPIGILDALTGYVRAEVRYDCVYSRGCGLFKGVNTYGDRAKRLPNRLSNALSVDGAGVIVQNDNTVDYSDKTRRPVPIEETHAFRRLFEQSKGADDFVDNPEQDEECLRLYGELGCSYLAGGSNSPIPVTDDPLPVLFERFQDFRFTQIKQRGGSDFGFSVFPMGPWLPKNFVVPNASMADVVNPFDNSQTSPKLQANFYNGDMIIVTYNEAIKRGFNELGAIDQNTVDRGLARIETLGIPDLKFGGALPFRPIPVVDAGRRDQGDSELRGIYMPSEPVRDLLDSGKLVPFPYNFREAELAWNRGESQQDEKELKEAYVDVEMFDSRLWMRLGRQTIVWGKTELFSSTDQFNPQDFALASLPTLEESRIPLWAARGVYSFYDIGPLSDARLELAFLFDQFQGADLGSCGEAYTVNPICGLTFGAFTHGFTGLGVVGVEHPDTPWESGKGWQFGGRFEFRWDRFSFAVSNFYGYDQFPHPKRIVTYERNVDPKTGLPRIIGARGRCTVPLGSTDPGAVAEPDCLQPGPTDREGGDANTELADAPNNALLFHPANQQLFAFACAATIGVAGSTNPAACGASVFNGQEAFARRPSTSAQILSATLAGSTTSQLLGLFSIETTIDEDTGGVDRQEIVPTVALSVDANDLANGGTDCMDLTWFNSDNNNFPNKREATCGGTGWTTFDLSFPDPLSLPALGLAEGLTPHQEALLGCGPFFGINCDVSGIDWLNAEGSALIQSFVGVEGTREGWRADGRMNDKSGLAVDANGLVIQPGTVGFRGGPRCTTGHIGGSLNPNIMLPGCRGPGDPGYNVDEDGDPTGVRTTWDLTSFGYQPAGVAGHPLTGQPWQNELAVVSWNLMVISVIGSDEFSPNRPYTPGVCSYVTPQKCSAVRGLLSLMATRRNDVRAGGTSRFGRRDFAWHGGGAITLDYEKRNVLGFGMDFAEDVTKTNFGIEFTWVNGVPIQDNNEFDGLTTADEFNLTISMDRPTFINFLNDGRTFFINTQWFLQYRTEYGSGWVPNGPWNILGTLTFLTGYYQDRLNPSLTLVYDVQSTSGAALSQVEYRVSANFSVSMGVSMFFGRQQLRDMAINPVSPGSNRRGRNAYKDATEQFLSIIRDRDEVFMRVRYTF